MSQDVLHYLILFGRITLIVVFAFSLWGKLKNFHSFEKSVANFEILMPQMVKPVSYLTLIGEGLIVFLGIIGDWLLIWSFLAAILMLSIFTLALSLVLKRGVDTSCNCFGSSVAKVSKFDIYRNIGFQICFGISALLLTTTPAQTAFYFIEYLLMFIVSAIFVWTTLNLRELYQLVN